MRFKFKSMKLRKELRAKKKEHDALSEFDRMILRRTERSETLIELSEWHNLRAWPLPVRINDEYIAWGSMYSRRAIIQDEDIRESDVIRTEKHNHTMAQLSCPGGQREEAYSPSEKFIQKKLVKWELAFEDDRVMDKLKGKDLESEIV